jgi:NAD kinase
MINKRAENKIVLIVRKTRLDELIARFNTEGQARFYVEHLGADFSDYQAEDRVYKKAIQEARELLARHGRVQVLDRSFLPNFIFGPNDTVVAVGQDGLVANVLKYLANQVLIGVNPDQKRWEGVLLPFTVQDLDRLLPEVLAGKRPIAEVSMAQARLNTGQDLVAVNDLFVGPRSHTSARYTIQTGNQQEYHSSSGVIISTGLGSTGWLRSILAGATGIAEEVSGIDLDPGLKEAVRWDADFLYFSVREPWPSTKSGAEITFGKVTRQQPLILTSQMAENGVIFSDGIEADYLEFNAGTEAVITLADQRGHLVT